MTARMATRWTMSAKRSLVAFVLLTRNPNCPNLRQLWPEEAAWPEEATWPEEAACTPEEAAWPEEAAEEAAWPEEAACAPEEAAWCFWTI